jgi:hypothetical protein
MKITRTSVFGVTRTIDLPVTQQQINAWEEGALAQIVFNNLDAAQREFIISGNTDEDWEKMFAENADSDV